LSSGNPLVSVIVIFLNAGAFLREAVESVLQQTCGDWELILVDDGSTDESPAIARQYAADHPEKVRCVEHPGRENRGMSASRNLGIRSARGKYVAFVDADDVWLPRKLAVQSAILESNPDAAMVFGPTLFWFGWTGDSSDAERDFVATPAGELDILVQPPRLLFDLLSEAPPATTCSILVRRRFAIEIGGFEERFRGLFEDAAFLAKVYLNGAVYISSECAAKYRMRPDSCVFNALNAGRYGGERRAFLDWLERYSRTRETRRADVRRAIQKAAWPLRHHIMHGTLQASRSIGREFRHWLGNVGLDARNFRRRLSHSPTGSIAAQPNPICLDDPFAARFRSGRTLLTWNAGWAEIVEVRVGAPDGPLVSRTGAEGSFLTGRWVRDRMTFFLQDVSGGKSLTARHTLGRVRVRVLWRSPAPNPPAPAPPAGPAGRIAASPNPILVTPGALDRIPVGATTLTWTCKDASTVEVRIDAPDGALLCRKSGSGEARTGDWVRDGMTFFLQDVSNGNGLTARHTLASVRVEVRVDAGQHSF
jgi:glycosyltransferase involved in cell wall biosynthesis